ncbi:MAG: hypothetical protein K6G11_04155 [Lachnospiraceae bacterium]|nr:hypothetical protein [Lachnospiraceae bacterium]
MTNYNFIKELEIRMKRLAWSQYAEKWGDEISKLDSKVETALVLFVGSLSDDSDLLELSPDNVFGKFGLTIEGFKNDLGQYVNGKGAEAGASGKIVENEKTLVTKKMLMTPLSEEERFVVEGFKHLKSNILTLGDSMGNISNLMDSAFIKIGDSFKEQNKINNDLSKRVQETEDRLIVSQSTYKVLFDRLADEVFKDKDKKPKMDN